MARKSKQTDVNIPRRVRTKAEQPRVGEVQSENEMFYRSIYENSPDAILLTAPDGVIHEANPAACQMFGRTVEEIRRIGRSGLVDGTDPRLARALDERTRLGYARVEITMLRADGAKFPVEITSKLFVNAQGQQRTSMIIRDLSESKRADETQQRSEEKYRDLVENINEVLYSVSVDGMITYVSPVIKAVLGYTPADLIGTHFTHLIFPEDQEKILQASADVLRGQLHPSEYRMFTMSGEVRWVRTSSRPVRDGEQISGIQGVLTDITERKLAEEELRESQLRERDRANELETILNSLPTLVWIAHDPECKYISGNWAASEFLRMPLNANQSITGLVDEAPGHFKFCQDGREIPPQELPVQLAARGVVVENFEEEVVFDDGSMRYLVGNAVPLYDEQGKPRGSVAAFRDITERRHAQEMFRREKIFAENIIETAQAIILVLDVEGRIVRFNHYLEEISGYLLEEVQGKDWFSTFLPERDRDRIRQLFLKAAGDIQTHGTVNPIVTKDGREREIEWNDRTLKDAQGNLVGLLSIGLDITERKQAEEALRPSEARFSTVFHSSPLSIAITRLMDNTFLDVNPAWQKLTGFDHEEVIGHTPIELGIWVDPADRDRLIMKFRQQGSVEDFEFKLRKKTGAILDVTFSAALIEVASEPCMLSMALEITERKRAEGSLRRRNDELNLLNQISRAFNRLMLPSEILELLYKDIGLVLDNHNLYIALYDETNQSISFPIYTVNGKRRESHNRPFGNGLTEYILRTKAPLMILHDQKSFLAEQTIDVVGVLSRSFLGAPMQVGDRVLGVIALQDYEREDAYEAGDLELISTIAGLAATALENSRLYGEIQHELNERKQTEIALRESRNRLAHLSHRLVQAQEKERRRIALELHDEVGQTLTALSMALDGITHTTREAAVRVKTARLQDMVRDLINQVSTISVELHPRDLDALGLIPGLISLFRRISAQTGIEVDFKHAGLEQMRFTSEIEISAYRIVQEALTNVIRHSGVKNASVRLQVDGDCLWIQVQDEGQGFDLQKDVNVEDSMGLLSMMERAEQIGGRLSIETAPGEGVNITCTLPLK